MEVIVDKYIYQARAYVSFDLKAEDYLKYDTEEDVMDAAMDDMLSEVDYGDVMIDESETDFMGLDKLIEEWKSLKGLK